MREVLEFHPQCTGMVHTCNLCVWEMEKGGPEIQNCVVGFEDSHMRHPPTTHTHHCAEMEEV